MPAFKKIAFRALVLGNLFLLSPAGLVPAGLAQEKPAREEPVPSYDYRIGANDVLEIKVFGSPELDRTVAVSGKGMIDFPFLGWIPTEGLTIEELTGKLEEGLGACCLVNPQVNIRVLEYNAQQVYLFGEVQKPGVYQLKKGKTLMELVIEAEGVTRKAAKGRVYILRRGKAERIKVDLDEIIKNSKMDVPLQPGDVIYVPESIF
jgi:protein involved in polysaccharide export with SLBB domain